MTTAESGEVDWSSVAKRLEEPLRQFARSGTSGAQAYKDRQLNRTALHRLRQTIDLIQGEVKAEREEREKRGQREEASREESGDLRRWVTEKNEMRKDVELAVETTERLARSEEISQAQRFWRRITSVTVGTTIVFATISAFNGEPVYLGASGVGLISSVGSAVLLRKSTPTPNDEEPEAPRPAG